MHDNQEFIKAVKTWINRYAYFIIYMLCMLACGVIQLLDWYYGSEDPIWHILFYIFFMPLFSLSYGFFAGSEKLFFLAPFTAAFLTAFVYIFMANGGFSISITELKSALQLCVPAFVTASAGVILRRIVMVLK